MGYHYCGTVSHERKLNTLKNSSRSISSISCLMYWTIVSNFGSTTYLQFHCGRVANVIARGEYCRRRSENINIKLFLIIITSTSVARKYKYSSAFTRRLVILISSSSTLKEVWRLASRIISSRACEQFEHSIFLLDDCRVLVRRGCFRV